MPIPTLIVADCQTIQKAFERGASYAVTEESVYAMMTPILSNMRIQSGNFIDQTEASESIEKPAGSFITQPNLNNIDKSDEEDEGLFTRVAGNFFPGGDEFGGLFNSECIPCGFRLNTMGELVMEAFGGLAGDVGDILKQWALWLSTMMSQLMSLIDIFSGLDKYVDLCALIKFLNDFVCIPDLQRILSALMALMARVSFDFGGLFDLILGLIAPLVTPFLSSLVDQIQKYILMVIKPLECIINAIQDIIRKLDYNVLFQNIDTLDKHISLGPKQGPWKPDPRGPIKVPFTDSEIPRTDVSESQKRAIDVEFNLAGPIGSAIKRQNEEDDKRVAEALAELEALEAAGRNVEGASAGEVERHRQQKEAAKQKYQDALEERNLSEVGQANKAISDTVSNLKSSLFELIGFLREAAQAVETFFQDLFGELKKIMGEYLGGSGSFIELLMKKNALVQIISFVTAVLKAFMTGLNCDDEKEDIRVEKFIPQQQGMKVWTDDQGNLHIEEDDAIFDAAIQEAVKAIGDTPYSTLLEPDGPAKKQQADKGTLPDTEEPRQKLKSMIEFTGDPVLDTQIARATEALVTPVKVTFKCPLQTTVDEAEQVNQWIKELNSE